MSFNGFISFIAGGERKNSYSHEGGLPADLGLDVLRWLREARAGDLAGAIGRLRVVNDGHPPSADDVRHLAPWTDLRVNGGAGNDWYCLTRLAQGKPAEIFKAAVVYDMGQPWGWVYVVDADAETLSVEDGPSWPWGDLPSDEDFVRSTADG